MALIFNGTEILSNMDLVFNGVSLDVINFNDVEVWRRVRGLNLLETPSATWSSKTYVEPTGLGEGTCTASVSDTSPYLTGSSDGGLYVYALCVTKEPIDFSNYNTLKITGRFHGDIVSEDVQPAVTRACCAFGCSSNPWVSIGYSGVAGIQYWYDTFDGGREFFHVASPIMEGTYTFDISDLNDSYYIKIITARAGLAPYGTFSVTEMVLE